MKKITVLVLILTICLSLILATTACASSHSGHNIEEIILGPSGLNILLPLAKETITRAEMAEIMLRFTKLDNEENGNRNRLAYGYLYMIEHGELFRGFKDWQLNGEQFDRMYKLYLSGVVRGCGNACYEPERDCTYIEMITFLVRALGYTVRADVMGDYPTGYIQIARELGLIDETVEFSTTDIHDLTQKTLFKALFTEVLFRQAHSYEYVYEYEPCPIESYFGLKYVEATATKTENGLEIDGESYIGELYNSPDFENGLVLCIYEELEDGSKKIKICCSIEEPVVENNLIQTQ